MKSISVIALERVIDELQQQKTVAVRTVAKPFDDKIASIYADIAKLEGKKVTETGTVIIHEYNGAKRGRKPKNFVSFVYPLNGTTKAKFMYIIKEAGRFVTINEMAAIAKIYEPNYSHVYLKLKLGKHIDKYRIANLIVSYKIGSRRNMLYGLPEWFKDGKPIEGREHDPHSLIDSVNEGDIITLSE